MATLVIYKTHQLGRHSGLFEPCVNRCRAQSGEYKDANHVAAFLDGAYRVALCEGCARAWRRVWAREVAALGSDRSLVVAA